MEAPTYDQHYATPVYHIHAATQRDHLSFADGISSRQPAALSGTRLAPHARATLASTEPQERSPWQLVADLALVVIETRGMLHATVEASYFPDAGHNAIFITGVCWSNLTNRVGDFAAYLHGPL